MARISRDQEQLRRRAASLQQQMQAMSQKAPVFSPGMQGDLQQAMQHMGQAGQRLAESDARQASGEQKNALDRLGKLQQAMEQAMQQGGGGGIPMPMSGGGPGGQGTYGMAHEPVKIPDADSFKAPAAFRKELMDAMKQGPPKVPTAGQGLLPGAGEVRRALSLVMFLALAAPLAGAHAAVPQGRTGAAQEIHRIDAKSPGPTG